MIQKSAAFGAGYIGFSFARRRDSRRKLQKGYQVRLIYINDVDIVLYVSGTSWHVFTVVGTIKVDVEVDKLTLYYFTT